ncbi:hypothetical protein [Moritella yayanosii]|uniref:SbsA Ig-like domain-containing protein n=1 Tax=Moritella yayanosii TaxID=69539 RepID=A0A330LVZ7_9GAMM|nr:hypothetical protein [Moritella yayanosii]SQD80392.1 exported protein of unknown function [Moritella yayanosii]
MKTINSRFNSFFSSFVKSSLVASAVALTGRGVELQDNEKVDAPLLTAEENRAALAQRRAQSLFAAHTFYAFPFDGQADVTVNTSVLLSFSHPLDTFSTQEFTLTDSDGDVVEGTAPMVIRKGSI